jgi:hypothetical protein
MLKYYILLLLGGVFILWCMPLSLIDNGMTLCIIKNATGHTCPGCGMTRAFFHLLHGDISTAYHYNWRIFIVLPILVGVAIQFLRRHIRNTSPSAIDT